MQAIQVSAVFCFAVVALSLASHHGYDFKYGVEDHHTGDIKSQSEKGHGGHVTGYYKLKEADGIERIVHYTADKHNGFTAHVERQGHAYHPQPHHHHEHHGHHYGHGHGKAHSYQNIHLGDDHEHHHDHYNHY